MTAQKVIVSRPLTIYINRHGLPCRCPTFSGCDCRPVRVFHEDDVRELWNALVGMVAATTTNVFMDKALADAAHMLADGGFPAPEDWTPAS